MSTAAVYAGPSSNRSQSSRDSRVKPGGSRQRDIPVLTGAAGRTLALPFKAVIILSRVAAMVVSSATNPSQI